MRTKTAVISQPMKGVDPDEAAQAPGLVVHDSLDAVVATAIDLARPQRA